MQPADRAARPPLFSIVTVVFNGARTIEAAVRSVSAQTCRDFEYIVIDGASTDGTVGILERLEAHIDHFTSERDSGIYDAWNKALDVARGEWIAFLGADDVYLPEALEAYERTIRKASARDIQYVSSRVQLVKSEATVRTIGSCWSWPAFAHHMTVAHVGSMHHRSLFAEYGRYDQSYRISADYELLLRPRELLRAAFCDSVTARMSIGGVSDANVRQALLEQERAKRTSGGRAAWLCALERQTAYLKHRVRSLVWY